MNRISFVTCAGLVACSSVQVIGRPPSEAELQRIVREGQGRSVELELDQDRKLSVGGLHAVGGRLSWAAPSEGSASADELRRATVVRRGKGFWEGFGIGA